MRSGTQLLRKGGGAVVGFWKGEWQHPNAAICGRAERQVRPLPHTLTLRCLLGAAYARPVECWMNGQREKERFKKHKIKVVEIWGSKDWCLPCSELGGSRLYSEAPFFCTHSSLSASALSFFFRPLTFSLSPLLHSALPSWHRPVPHTFGSWALDLSYLTERNDSIAAEFQAKWDRLGVSQKPVW